MIGVILWSNVKERKAVVWCEDQGDLAFLGCDDARAAKLENLEVGEMLQFDIEIEGDFRRISNPTLLHNYARIDVAAELSNNAVAVRKSTAKVLAFPSPAPSYTEPDNRSDVALITAR